MEKIEKYMDYFMEQMKLWNMKETVKPIAVGRLGTVPKDLEKRLEEFEIRDPEWRQVSSSLQDSSQYSGWSQ